MKWIDKHFGAVTFAVLFLSFATIAALTTWALDYDRVHQCHSTSTYHWATYCQTIPVGKTFIVSCHQEYVPDVVCDKP